LEPARVIEFVSKAKHQSEREIPQMLRATRFGPDLKGDAAKDQSAKHF